MGKSNENKLNANPQQKGKGNGHGNHGWIAYFWLGRCDVIFAEESQYHGLLSVGFYAFVFFHLFV